MSDLVGYPEDRFSRMAANLSNIFFYTKLFQILSDRIFLTKVEMAENGN